MSMKYIRSENFTVQAPKDEVYTKYVGNGYTVKPEGKGNGNWIVSKKGDVLVDGISQREFILEYYNRKRFTESLAMKFMQDVEDGNIEL